MCQQVTLSLLKLCTHVVHYIHRYLICTTIQEKKSRFSVKNVKIKGQIRAWQRNKKT